MAVNFYTLITTTGKAKMANAAALGTKVNFKTLKVGDGNGNYYEPTENQTNLLNTVWQGNIGSISIDENNSNWIVTETTIPATDGGFSIREAGIFDEDGDLIAISKMAETYKPVAAEGSTKNLIVQIILEVSNSSSVTLKIDPNVVIATKNDIAILTNSINSITTQLSDVAHKNGTLQTNLNAEKINGLTKDMIMAYKSDVSGDFNNYTITGLYKFGDTSSISNQPAISWGLLEVFCWGGYLIQRASTVTNNYAVYQRTRNDGNVWSAWKQIATLESDVPTFLNGWGNITDPNYNVKISRTGNIVTIDGDVIAGIVTAQTNIMLIPTNFRPQNKIIPVITIDNNCNVEIRGDGYIRLTYAKTAITQGSTYSFNATYSM